ncbi:MAG TPA: tetratricopeptide repeat protein, partial [Oligoflexia bacterium]|nr:tetratricopeptide repeat protein [Oligoflexia bacterium]
ASAEEQYSAPTLRKRLAQLYLRQGDLNRALSETETGIEQDSENTDLIKLRAGILAAKKRNPEAIAEYKRLIELSKAKSEDPYILLASLYAQENDMPAAKATLDQLLKAKPKSFIAVYYLARLAVTSGDLAEAETLYHRALELTPNKEPVYLDLARVYTLQKRFDKAIEITDQLIKRNPGNIKARELRGDILLGKDQVPDALTEFETLSKIETDPSQTRLKIGLIKLQRRDYEGAETELRLVLSQHPENAPARYYLASTYAAMKRVEDALEQIRAIKPDQEYFLEASTLGVYLLREVQSFDRAVELVDNLLTTRPNNLRLMMLKASLLRDDKRLPEAIKLVEQVISLQQESKTDQSDDYHFTLGVYLDEAGRKDEALASMRRAIELNPNNANALNYLGYSYAEAGINLEEALDLINRALALEPQNGYYIDSLGWAYYQMGRYEDALRELKRAAELANEDAVILEHYARALLKLNRRDDAIKALHRARDSAPDSEDKE